MFRVWDRAHPATSFFNLDSLHLPCGVSEQWAKNRMWETGVAFAGIV